MDKDFEESRLGWVALTCVVCSALAFVGFLLTTDRKSGKEFVTVGFVLDGDDSTPYSANFIRAIEALEL